MHIDYRTGHILTTNLNPPSSWGEYYAVFDTIEQAQTYCEAFPERDIEFVLCNSLFEFMGQIEAKDSLFRPKKA